MQILRQKLETTRNSTLIFKGKFKTCHQNWSWEEPKNQAKQNKILLSFDEPKWLVENVGSGHDEINNSFEILTPSDIKIDQCPGIGI
jgi:hypothetical protein